MQIFFSQSLPLLRICHVRIFFIRIFALVFISLTIFVHQNLSPYLDVLQSTRSCLQDDRRFVIVDSRCIQFSSLARRFSPDRHRFSALYLQLRLVVLIVFNFLPLFARRFSSRLAVSRGTLQLPAHFTARIIITFSPPTREVEEWKRVVLIILSRDRQPRPLSLFLLFPPVPSPVLPCPS